jgi:hypothetical protein
MPAKDWLSESNSAAKYLHAISTRFQLIPKSNRRRGFCSEKIEKVDSNPGRNLHDVMRDTEPTQSLPPCLSRGNSIIPSPTTVDTYPPLETCARR